MIKVGNLVFLVILLICLTSVPLTVYASDSTVITVTGKLDEDKEVIDESTNENKSLEEKQTVIKKGQLPKTGESTTFGMFVGGMLIICVISNVYKKEKSNIN